MSTFSPEIRDWMEHERHVSRFVKDRIKKLILKRRFYYLDNMAKSEILPVSVLR